MRIGRRGLLGVAAAATAGALVPTAGCASGPDEAAADRLTARWAEAVRRRDREQLLATVTGPASTRLVETLLAVPFAEDGFAVTSTHLVGTTASIGVRWRLADDRGPVEDVLTADLRRGWDGSDRLVVEPATTAPPPADHPVLHLHRPVWWLDDLTADTSQAVTVLRSRSLPPRPWAELAGRARDAASRRTGRSSALTVVVPSSPQVLRQVIPLDGPTDTRAAFAWSMGDPDGPIHVFVDPVASAAVDDATLLALLTHETVHVLTGSPRTALPLWVEEGYADAVAFADDRAAGLRANAALVEAVRSGARPPMTAPDPAFLAGAGQALAYATAWSVAQWIGESAGPAGLRRWYDLQAPPAGTAGVAEEAAWRTVTGSDPADREPAWRSWLDELVR